MNSELQADSRITRLIEFAIMEDIGPGDVTSDAILQEGTPGYAEFLCKADGVVAGLEIAALVFELCDPSSRVRSLVADGSDVRSGQILATVKGSARAILHAERTALNFLQRMSGIATLTRTYVQKVAGTRARITDTRKTVPGLRVIDKMAVRLGGGVNHRFGLDDMVLIKDNHIVAAGGITKAVEQCRAYLQARALDRSIEVETRNLEEVDEVLRCAGVSRIMLDNFGLDSMRTAVARIARRLEVEASGGITLETVRAVADAGVDFISVGALTHSVRSLDISLEMSHHV
jgi:nicotinate-nucleotide pyrophosphorylase (carboxylating)